MANFEGGLNLTPQTLGTLDDLAKMDPLKKGAQVSVEAGRFKVVQGGGAAPGIEPKQQEQVLKILAESFKELSTEVTNSNLDDKTIKKIYKPSGTAVKAAEVASKLLESIDTKSGDALTVQRQTQAILNVAQSRKKMSPQQWVNQTCPEMANFAEMEASLNASRNPKSDDATKLHLTPHNPGGTVSGAYRVTIPKDKGGKVNSKNDVKIAGMQKPMNQGLEGAENPTMILPKAYGCKTMEEFQALAEKTDDLYEIQGLVMGQQGTSSSDYGMNPGDETIRDRMVYVVSKSLGCGVPPTAITNTQHPVFEGIRDSTAAVFKHTLVHIPDSKVQEALIQSGGSPKEAALELVPTITETLRENIDDVCKQQGLTPLSKEGWQECLGNSKDIDTFMEMFTAKLDTANGNTGDAQLITGKANKYLTSMFNNKSPSKAVAKELINLAKDVNKGSVSRPVISSLQQWIPETRLLGSSENKQLAAGALEGAAAVDEQEWNKEFLQTIPNREWSKFFLDVVTFGQDRNDLNVLVKDVSKEELMVRLTDLLPPGSGMGTPKGQELIKKLLGLEISSQEDLDNNVKEYSAQLGLTSLEQKLDLEDTLAKLAFSKTEKGNPLRELVLIDNSQAAPNPDIGNVLEKGQRVAFWMGLQPAREARLTGVRKEMIESRGVDEHIAAIKQDQLAHLQQFGAEELDVKEQTYDLLRVCYLLTQVAAEEDCSLHETGLTIMGEVVEKKGTFGKEIGTLYNYHKQQKAHHMGKKVNVNPREAEKAADRDTKEAIRNLLKNKPEARKGIKQCFEGHEYDYKQKSEPAVTAWKAKIGQNQAAGKITSEEAKDQYAKVNEEQAKKKAEYAKSATQEYVSNLMGITIEDTTIYN